MLKTRPFIQPSLLVLATLLAAQTSAFAQQSPTPATPAAEQAGELEAIVVTGSRIRRDPLSQAAPVLDISAQDLERTGLTSVADILQRLPSSGGGLNTKFNSSGNFGFPADGGGVGAGGAEIDLRYLGSRRTLVLVDGLRFVNGSSASGVPGSTDLNTIPEGLIDRIEVLQDGASSIYGSDAIAGVVNIITKKKFDGVGASAYAGIYDEGDGFVQSYNLTFGSKGDKTSIVLGFNYTDQGSISSGDRALSSFPQPGITECNARCSSATPRGRFIFAPNPNVTPRQALLDSQISVTLRPGLVGQPRFNPANPTGPGSDFVPFAATDRFNFAPFNFLLTPSKRTGFFGTVTHEFADNLNLTVKGLYNNRKSANQAAPIPLFIGPDAGNGDGSILDLISIDATNPFNPFGFTLNAQNGFSFIGRRLVEAGPRRFEQNVNTYYGSATLDGSFNLGERKFFFDLNAVYSENSANQTFTGNVNARRLQQALGPISQCTAPCVPVNLFGGAGTITPAQLAFISFVQQDSSIQKLADFTANISGELFNLPAGPVGIAIGYEHRDQRGSFTPDAVVTAGESSDVPASPTSGRLNFDEVYAELNVPLLADLPFAKVLEASFAVRRTKLSTGPSATPIKAGLLYRPTQDLTLRSSYSEGFRAPTIGELFGTPTRFDAVLDDPCSGAPAATRANCAALGVPASFTQLNSQISTTTGGNINLDPETSTSYNLGAVYSPSWIENVPGFQKLTLELDFYRIKVSNSIQGLDAQVILNQCVATLDPTFCSLIGRTPSGAINRFNNQLVNTGGVKTSGLDFTLTYTSPDTSFGQFILKAQNAFLLNFEERFQTSTGFNTVSREGNKRNSPDQSFPKFKSTTTLTWLIGDFNTALTGRYISGITETCQNANPQSLCSNPNPTAALSTNRLKPRLYTDLQVTFTPAALEEKFGFTLGINNLFDANPPACFSCQLNGFDPTTFDVPGQFFYGRITAKF